MTYLNLSFIKYFKILQDFYQDYILSFVMWDNGELELYVESRETHTFIEHKLSLEELETDSSLRSLIDTAISNIKKIESENG